MEGATENKFRVQGSLSRRAFLVATTVMLIRKANLEFFITS